jgi:hypothetical protein
MVSLRNAGSVGGDLVDELEVTGFQASALLIGPPISGVILGQDSTQLLSKFKYGIILNGIMLLLGAAFGIGGKLYQDKRLFGKV